jgi:hypothetical protein
MRTRIFTLIALLGALSLLAFAADVTGKWTAQVPGRDGQMREQTFTFKAAGEQLTGTVTMGQAGEVAFSEGKVAGDTISFKVTREFGGNTITWTYTGAVSGNEIKFKRAGGQGEPIEFTAKKAQ